MVSQGEYIEQIWKLLLSDFLMHELHEFSGQPDTIRVNRLSSMNRM